MKTLRNTFWLIFITLIAFQTKASKGPILITNTDSLPAVLPFAEYLIDSSGNLSIENILQGNLAWKKFNAAKPNLGLKNQTIWVRFNVQNTLKSTVSLMLEVDYPRYDSVYFYQFFKESLSYSARSGDGLPYAERPILTRNIVFPVELTPKKRHTCYLKLNKTGDVALPISLLSQASYDRKNYMHNLFYGFYFGLLGFALIYAVVLAFSMRRQTFWYYAAYLLFLAYFMATTRGFTFEFIFPNTPYLVNEFYAICADLCIMAFLLFAVSFMNLNRYFPILSKILRGSVWTMAGLVLVFVLFPDFFSGKNNSILMAVNLFVMLIGVLTALTSGILMSLKKHLAGHLFTGSFIGMLVGVIIHILKVGGMIPLTFLTNHSVFIGSTYEILVLSLGTGYVLKKEADEKHQLAEKVSHHKANLLKVQSETEIRERQRIARDLHDHVGSELAGLKLALGKLSTEEAHDKLEHLAGEVRNLSHQLNPGALTQGGLKEAIEDFLSFFSHSNHLEIAFHHTAFPDSFQHENNLGLFLIFKECMTNIGKHSQAKKVEIELILLEDQICLTVYDHGKGFDLSSGERGIGIQNMQARTESLGGVFDIDSGPEGTSVFVTVPTKKP